MSQTPKKHSSARRVPAEALPGPDAAEDFDYDEEESYDTEPDARAKTSAPVPAGYSASASSSGDKRTKAPRGQASAPRTERTESTERSASATRGGVDRNAARDRRYPASVVHPQRRDYFPYVMGALIGALIVGLLAVTYLFGSSRGSGAATVSGTQNSPGPIQPVSGNSSGQATQPVASGEEPPRIPLNEFKALYDDPAKRPLVIDVRAKDVYDQSHMKGAVSFPEADVDTRVAELPKDKLIVAYCQ